MCFFGSQSTLCCQNINYLTVSLRLSETAFNKTVVFNVQEVNVVVRTIQFDDYDDGVRSAKSHVADGLPDPEVRHLQLAYTVSQKNCAKLFLSELRQISANFDNFWEKDGKDAEIMRSILIFHLT